MFRPLNLFRAVCFLIALGGVGVAWVYVEKSSWIYAVDWHATKLYERSLMQELKGLAPNKYKGDEATRLNRLNEIRTSCRSAVFGERRFWPWRLASEMQVSALTESGQHVKALPLLKEALGKDPRNLFFVYRTIEAQILSGLPAEIEEAGQRLSEWEAKLSSHSEIWSLRILLASQNRDAQAVAGIVREKLPRTVDLLKYRWQMFLFPEGKGAIVKSPPINFVGPLEDGSFVLDYTFVNPPQVSKVFRIDPPGHLPQRLVDLSVQMWVGEVPVAPEQTSKWLASFKVAGLSDDSLGVMIDEDPRLRLQLTGNLEAQEAVRVRVTGRLFPLLNSSTREILSDAKFRNLVSSLLDAGEGALTLDDVSPISRTSTGGSQ